MDIRGKKKSEDYIHTADWYTTFRALARIDPTDNAAAKANLPPIDSKNMWPLLSGKMRLLVQLCLLVTCH